MKLDVTQKELKENLSYEPETGLFRRLYTKGGRVRGSVAGSVHTNHKTSKAYVEIKINLKLYKAHRLAFLYMEGVFPPEEVDHINGNGVDNKWSNLRKVTKSENQRNERLSKNNTSGVIGVCFDKQQRRWATYIRNNEGKTCFKRFTDFNDAVKWRRDKEIEYGYHANHGETRPL